MVNFYKILVLVFAVSLAVITVNAAQPIPSTLHKLLLELQSNNERVNFEFVAPLIGNVRSVDVDSSVFNVGEDYVCFTENWNQGTRQRCTPFSNIASVTFAD
jgi:hypothetical protein